MSGKPPRDEATGRVIHLPKDPHPPGERRRDLREVERDIVSHFREQNEMLLAHREEQRERIREQGESLRQHGEMVERLTRGVERLVEEMHGVRTGRKEEAFARIGGMDASSDLPTVSSDSAVHYIHTAGSIGLELGFRASEIGTLLGARGLGWAGDGDYQETGRKVGPGATKFWHLSVPERLRRILDENKPERYGISDKAILSMFRKWRHRRAEEAFLAGTASGGVAH